MSQASPATPLRIGVLVHAPTQLLDLSAIDLFGMLTPEYLKACRLPQAITNLGIPVDIKYISSLPFPDSSSPSSKNSAAAATSPAPHLAILTASAHLLLTHTLSSPEVQPGLLDIILIPGPDPNEEIPDAVGEWLRGHFEHEKSGGGASEKVTLMSVCTGIFVLAPSGVLEGLDATAPRALVPELRKRWPGVKWTAERRWVRSGGGRVWTSGGVTNGLDMVAAFLREKYPGSLSDTVCLLADVGDRKEKYQVGQVAYNGMWLWAVFRAWFFGKK